jgi:RNA polymerase sigma-70 factor (ECF subfamily)
MNGSQMGDDIIHSTQDRSLLGRLQSGDAEALAAVMRDHNRALWRVARGILRDDADAEEAVQEAYLRAFSGIGGFRGESTLSTWLMRIAINEALRILAKRRAIAAPSADPANQDSSEDAPDPPRTPEHDAARREIRRMMERAVDNLPAPFRLVFLMRMVEQMSVEETAAALRIEPATVKTRLHRAKEQLRRSLGAELASALEGAFPFAGRRCERLSATVLARLRLHAENHSKGKSLWPLENESSSPQR